MSFARLGFIEFSVTDVERSAKWYRELFGLQIVRERRREGRLEAVILRHEPSRVEVGLIQHEANDGQPFSEFRTGLDHLEFMVRDREDLDVWRARLDDLGVTHSEIKVRPGAAILTFRDPDNIQLEFYWTEEPGRGVG